MEEKRKIWKGDRRLCLREKEKVSSIVFWIGYPRSTWNFHFRRCMVLWQPLCHIHVGAALNNDGYFHILCLTSYQHLFIIRTLSSSHFPLSGFLCFFFLCVCVCVFYFFFIIIFFTVPQWEDRKFNFFDIIIFAFLETQSPSVSAHPSKYTSVPFLFFKLVALLVLLVQHVIATTWIFQAFWARDHLTYSPLSLSEDHCLSFQKVLFVVDLVFLLAKMQ